MSDLGARVPLTSSGNLLWYLDCLLEAHMLHNTLLSWIEKGNKHKHVYRGPIPFLLVRHPRQLSLLLATRDSLVSMPLVSTNLSLDTRGPHKKWRAS